MASIIFVGGFGASVKYSEAMCMNLQRLTLRKVHNFSLCHGLTIEEECQAVLNALPNTSSSYVMMGFSTGCLIAMSLSRQLNTEQIILINPAEVLTRLNRNTLDFLVGGRVESDRNIATFVPIMKREGYSPSTLSNIWFVVKWVWWAAMLLIGKKRIAEWYYVKFAKGFNEPRADELQRIVFSSRPIDDLKKTLVECILKPSLQKMIAERDHRVFIVQGYDDLLYIPYVRAIYDRYKNVTLHRTPGDHHMIYHHPGTVSQKIAALIASKLPF